MLHLMIGRDWTANRQWILNRIAQDVHARKPGRILMVPELISHEMERRLARTAGDTASRYAEVLSFSRLARRVSDEMGNGVACLDKGGRVVAMAAAARQLSSRLKAYASVETKPEFLSGLIDAVDEFKRCCITSVDLQTAAHAAEGSFAQKLEELALIMEAYDSICARGKRDPRDQEQQLLEQLEDGTFGENHVFYIDGFPDFTRQHLAILEHLIRVSPEVTVSLTCDTPGSSLMAFEKAGATAQEILRCAHRAGIPVQIETLDGRRNSLTDVAGRLFQGPMVSGLAAENLKVYHSQDPYEASMAAAEQILQGVRNGARYRDYTIVCTDMAVYQPVIQWIFHRMDIPVYQSGMDDILQKSVIITVLNALDAVLSGFEQRETLRYLRSALSPIEPDVCDDVENYAVVWGVRGKRWAETWKNHPEGLSGVWTDAITEKVARLDEVRARVMAPLFRLQKGFRDAKSLAQQVLALYGFLEEIHLEERLSDLADQLDAQGDNRNAQILNQLWEILLSALEQLYDVLGETVWEPEHFARLLRLLLSQYDVGTIPPVLDAVQVGMVSAMRCHEEKHLIVLGAEEGKLPGYTGSSGILTDQERVALRAMGVPLTGGSLEGIQAEFAEIYGVFCGATETVTVHYAGDQPSYVCRRLADLAGGEQNTVIDLGFAQHSREEAGAWLARWDGETAASRLNATDSYWETCRRRSYTLGDIAPEHIRSLYGDTIRLSASQIDSQGDCRLSHFLQYGLRAQERKEATVDPAEFGTYVHAVLEDTVKEIRDKGGFHQVSREETLEIAHRYSDAYAQEHFSQLDSERMRYLFRRNGQELDMVVAELWQELRNAQFEPQGFEVSFGKDGDFPPIPIPNGGLPAILRGFIDRMDIWQQGPTTYYRVVDYKTGQKNFDYCDVFNGVGLQMLLYMFALKHSGMDLLGEHPVAAGVQYFPARAPYITVDGRVTEEDAESARNDKWKRQGLLLDDEAVLLAMEPEDGPGRMNYKVNKQGKREGDLADRDQLKMLEQYVFRILGRMVEDIASGNVEPNPYTRGTSHNACTYCPYGSVCHEETVAGRRDYEKMSSQRFWMEIGKELESNGGTID